MISSVALEGIWMWDVKRSGKVERLLALASCNQQFLSHDLYAGVVRQLQIVDAGHDWGEEVIRVLRRLECLPHNRQRGIQAPETWETRTPPMPYAFTLYTRTKKLIKTDRLLQETWSERNPHWSVILNESRVSMWLIFHPHSNSNYSCNYLHVSELTDGFTCNLNFNLYLFTFIKLKVCWISY